MARLKPHLSSTEKKTTENFIPNLIDILSVCFSNENLVAKTRIVKLYITRNLLVNMQEFMDLVETLAPLSLSSEVQTIYY